MIDDGGKGETPKQEQEPSQQTEWEAMADEKSWFRHPIERFRARRRQKQDENNLHHELKQRQGRITATSVIRYTKIIAVTALVLSLIYTFIIFLIGMASVEGGQAILSQIPFFNQLVPEASDTTPASETTPNGWSTYFLLALPATLTAVLGITVWVSGLRYAMSFYSDKEPTQQDDSLGTNSLLAEILKRLPPPSNNP